MTQRSIARISIVGLLLGFAGSAWTQPPASKSGLDSADAKAILANVQAYTDAYNKRDVKALLALFTEDCVVVEANGDRFRGLKELEAEFVDTFAIESKEQVSVTVDSIDFIGPDSAVESGRVASFPDGKTLASEVEYQVVHVKKGPLWLMSHVRTFNRKSLSPYDRLRELEWLVGDWVDEGGDSLIESSYRWDANKSFLLQEFTVRIKGRKALTGSQRIGVDPLSKQIKGWVFDSEGGYAESIWANVDDGWVIKAKGVRADGKVVTATNEIRQIAKDRARFESVDRIAGEDRFPGFTSFVVRKPPAPRK